MECNVSDCGAHRFIEISGSIRGSRRTPTVLGVGAMSVSCYGPLSSFGIEVEIQITHNCSMSEYFTQICPYNVKGMNRILILRGHLGNWPLELCWWAVLEDSYLPYPMGPISLQSFILFATIYKTVVGDCKTGQCEVPAVCLF